MWLELKVLFEVQLNCCGHVNHKFFFFIIEAEVVLFDLSNYVFCNWFCPPFYFLLVSLSLETYLMWKITCFITKIFSYHFIYGGLTQTVKITEKNTKTHTRWSSLCCTILLPCMCTIRISNDKKLKENSIVFLFFSFLSKEKEEDKKWKILYGRIEFKYLKVIVFCLRSTRKSGTHLKILLMGWGMVF